MTKAIVIAVAAVALITAAPVGAAQGASARTQAQQHRISARHHRGLPSYAARRDMDVTGARTGYPGAFGYAPGPSRRRDSDIESSRQAGGGGGGGGGGGM